MHPPPVTPCRLATDAEVPTGANNIRKHAEKHDWTVTVTFARGTQLGRVARVATSVVLRMRRNNECAVAAWIDGKFDCAYVWTVDSFAQKVTATELRARLA